jgi:hypothetical protein
MAKLMTLEKAVVACMTLVVELPMYHDKGEGSEQQRAQFSALRRAKRVQRLAEMLETIERDKTQYEEVLKEKRKAAKKAEKDAPGRRGRAGAAGAKKNADVAPVEEDYPMSGTHIQHLQLSYAVKCMSLMDDGTGLSQSGRNEDMEVDEDLEVDEESDKSLKEIGSIGEQLSLQESQDFMSRLLHSIVPHLERLLCKRRILMTTAAYHSTNGRAAAVATTTATATGADDTQDGLGNGTTAPLRQEVGGGFELEVAALREAERTALRLGPALMTLLVRYYNEPPKSLELLELAHRAFLGLVRVAVSSTRYAVHSRAINNHLDVLQSADESDCEEELCRLLQSMQGKYAARSIGATGTAAGTAPPNTAAMTGTTQVGDGLVEQLLKNFSKFYLKRSSHTKDMARGHPFVVALLGDLTDCVDPTAFQAAAVRRRCIEFLSRKFGKGIKRSSNKVTHTLISMLAALPPATKNGRLEAMRAVVEHMVGPYQDNPTIESGLVVRATASTAISSIVGVLDQVVTDVDYLLLHLDANRQAAKLAREAEDGRIHSDDEGVPGMRADERPRNSVYEAMSTVAELASELLKLEDVEFDTEMKLLAFCCKFYKLQVRMADRINAVPGISLPRPYKAMMNEICGRFKSSVTDRLAFQANKKSYATNRTKRGKKRGRGADENEDPQEEDENDEDYFDDEEVIDSSSKSSKKSVNKQGRVIPQLVFQVESLDARLVKMIKTVTITDKKDVGQWVKKTVCLDVRL